MSPEQAAELMEQVQRIVVMAWVSTAVLCAVFIAVLLSYLRR